MLEDGAADLMSETSPPPMPTADHLATERAP
jgi:hypothetical protein